MAQQSNGNMAQQSNGNMAQRKRAETLADAA